MTPDRAALLGLLHRADAFRSPVRYVVRQQRQQRLLHAAQHLYQSAVSGGLSSAAGAPSPPSGVEETEHRCWISGRRRFRYDGVSAGSRTVFDGFRLFTWDPSRRAPGAVEVTRDAGPPPGVAEMHGRSLLVEGDVEVIGETAYLGRPALLVRSTTVPRPTPYWQSPRSPLSAGRRELVVDAECGLILRDEAFFFDESMAVHEITDIEFEPAFDDDVFAFVSPDGRQPPDPEMGGFEQAQVWEVVDAAGFPLFVPASVELGESMWATRWHIDGRIGVQVSYLSPTNADGLTIFQAPWAPEELSDEGRAELETTGRLRARGLLYLVRDEVWIRLATVLKLVSPSMSAGAAPPAPPLDLDAIADDLVLFDIGVPPELVDVDADGNAVR